MRTAWLSLFALAGCPGPASTTSPPASPSASASASSSPSSSLPPLAAALLAEHNAVRARHCAPPLVWSAQLAAIAQQWADQLREHGCGFDHSRSPYGENLAAGTSGMLDAAGVVGMWADEESGYDFRRGGFSMDTGHFTQVVWRETTMVGCGTATCNGLDLFVCNYDPPGNVDGGFSANVKPTGC